MTTNSAHHDLTGILTYWNRSNPAEMISVSTFRRDMERALLLLAQIPDPAIMDTDGAWLTPEVLTEAWNEADGNLLNAIRIVRRRTGATVGEAHRAVAAHRDQQTA